MKNIFNFIYESIFKKSSIKIPKKLYYDEILLGKDAIKKITNEFEDYFTPAQIKKLFKGDENKSFKMIYWNSNSRGYRDAANTLYKLFGEDGWIDGWSDYADYFEFVDEDSNTALGKFTSSNGKVINVIDVGDWGYVYTCIEE